MNVLILTPDAVGSTLLQRLITIYMQFHSYDRPVINLHELTNGLVKYQNEKFNQAVLGKKDGAWGYHQSLEEIVELLSSVGHYKTSRLAHYHIRGRQDTMADQIPFYQYLNDNFYIISCRRHNIFEHALSWCLNKVTKKLNVYTVREKIDSFFTLYKNGIDLDPNSLVQTLNAYKDYVVWCNNHFNVASYFYYEEHLPRIESYILNLPIFAQQNQLLSWKDNFDIEFDQWNLCHYVSSDLGILALEQPEKFAKLALDTKEITISQGDWDFLNSYKNVRHSGWPEISSLQEYNNLPESIKNEVETKYHIKHNKNQNEIVSYIKLPQPLAELLPQDHQNFLKRYQATYNNSMQKIQQMTEDGILVNNPPIKKQTLAEKKHIIKNYNHLLEVYNQWILANPEIGSPLDSLVLEQFAQVEQDRWNPAKTKTALSVQQKND
jgi:hypothetical protein